MSDWKRAGRLWRFLRADNGRSARFLSFMAGMECVMLQRRCDRCRAEIPLSGAGIIHLNLYTYDDTQNWTSIASADLCDNCRKALDGWLQGPFIVATEGRHADVQQ